MNNYKEILENLGYKLKDHGQYWRTNAIYRSGDNSTALQIYKESGVWKDYVEDGLFLPFEALLQKTLNTKDNSIIKSIFKKNAESIYQSPAEKKLLKEEKTYPASSLSRLLPHYDFYIERGIPQEILKKYKCGLSTSGKMYQRTIFPIFRIDGKIHGFSGRKIDFNESKPKWLHVGRVSDWFYPIYSIKDVSESISNSKTVFIVESIGDSLALYKNGIKNNLVSFGLNISPKFISKLSGLNLDKIIIAFNNDSSSEKNRGFEGAVKTILKLIDSFDFKSIYFLPPQKNDFGDMSDNDIINYLSESKTISHKDSMHSVIKFSEKMLLTNNSKSFNTSLKKLTKLYKFTYE